MEEKLDITVLCVDDEAEIVEAMAHHLSRSVRQVYSAGDGLEALKVLQTHPVDAVITDIRMPNMDGMALSKAIRESYGDLPVVILSAFNDENYLLNAIELGVKKYLYKPVNMTLLRALLEEIAQVVGLRRQVASGQRLLQEYRAALDRTALVSRADAQGLIRYANENFCLKSGFREQELLGQRYEAIRHSANPDSLFDEIRATLEAGKSWHGVIHNRSKEGREYYVESTIVPLTNEQGQAEYLSVDYEVTEREIHQHEKQARLIKMRSEQHKHYLEAVGVLQRELAEKSARITEVAQALATQKGLNARYQRALEQADENAHANQDQIAKLQTQIEAMAMSHKGVLGKVATLEDRNRQLTRMMESRHR